MILTTRRDKTKKLRQGAAITAVLMLTGCFQLGLQEPAPTAHYGLRGGAGSTGMHTVAAMETLPDLAARYGLAAQDVVMMNNLQPPYDLRPGMRLKLPAPRTYVARQDDNLYRISRMFGVSQNELAQLNNMPPPYAVTPGQSLTLPTPQPVYQAPPVPAEPQFTDYAYNAPPGPSMARVDAVQAETLAPQGAMEVAQMPPQPFAQPVPQPAAKPAQLPVSLTTPALATPGKFMWPVDGRVISGYGPKEGGLHNDGVNIGAAAGAPVRAAENGTVVYAGEDLKGFGKLVLIRHADRWMTAYAHMSDIAVARGQNVTQGERIGAVGTSGTVTEPQLHFEVRRGAEALNPEVYLARQRI